MAPIASRLARALIACHESVPSGYIQTGGGPNGSAGNSLLHNRRHERPQLLRIQLRRLPGSHVHAHERQLQGDDAEQLLDDRDEPWRQHAAGRYGYGYVYGAVRDERHAHPGELYRAGT